MRYLLNTIYLLPTLSGHLFYHQLCPRPASNLLDYTFGTLSYAVMAGTELTNKRKYTYDGAEQSVAKRSK